MKTLTLLVGMLLFTVTVEAQVVCTQIGQFLSCDGPKNQNTTQLNLGNGMGVITDSKGNVEPYSVLPPITPRPSVVPSPATPVAPHAPASPGTFEAPGLIQPIEPLGQPMFVPLVGGESGSY